MKDVSEALRMSLGYRRGEACLLVPDRVPRLVLSRGAPAAARPTSNGQAVPPLKLVSGGRSADVGAKTGEVRHG